MLILNYRPVLRQPTGIGVYANSVLTELQQLEHILISGGGSGGNTERLNRLAWTQFELPWLAKTQKADLIFTPAPEGYLGNQVVPQVIMVHDLRPLIHSEQSLQSLYFKYWVPALLRQCKHILTNSNFTASEIQRSTDVSREKISVTSLGYDCTHFNATSSGVRLHERPYILHVGQAYPHKNLQRLVKAFADCSDRFGEVDLILAGKSHVTETPKLYRLVQELGLSKRVHFKNYVSYVDLPNWYRGALALIYPSLWEGFGLPLLEAMACGCPVVTSYGSGMQEVADDAAIYIDPFDLESIKHSLVKVLSEDFPRTILLQRGFHRCKSYTWDKVISMTKKEIMKTL